jgi:tetratricopeptide (TPR) repeat protein
VQLARGRVLQKMNRMQETIILYNEILARSTDNKVFCEAVAEVAIHYMKERDFYEAFSYLKRTHLLKVRSRPTDSLLRLAEGLTFLMKKKYA